MYKYILFDLDGTLTDPGLGITNAVMYSLEKMNIEVPARSELYKFIGPPLKESYTGFIGMSPEEAETAIKYYREYYSEKGLYENKIYPGIKELLEKLKAEGYICLVATSKPEGFTRKILEHFDILKYFDFIAAATMDGSRSEKADIIRYALSSMNISFGALMVGDRIHDAYGAGRCGLDCIGVTYGYGSREELINGEVKYVADTPEDIYNLISINNP